MGTFDPIEFNYQVGRDWVNDREVRMSNIKPGKNNHHVEFVRKELSKLWPTTFYCGTEYDDDMVSFVKKFQRSLGEPESENISKEQVVALGNLAEPPFTVA